MFGGVFDSATIESKIKTLEAQSGEPNFWDDAKKAEASMLFSRKAVDTSLVNKLRHRLVAEAAQTKGK